MMENKIVINRQDLLFVLRKGLWVFIIFLLGGGFISFGWFNHLKATAELPIYNRSIKIFLNRDVVKESNFQNLIENKAGNENENVLYKNNVGKNAIQFELYNVSKSTGVTLKEEREAYSDILQKEMEGPLKVKRFSFDDEGLLRFWVNVKLHKNDSRISNLMNKLNLQRKKTVIKLEQKLKNLKQKIIQYNEILNQLEITNVNGNNGKLIRLIKDEKFFIKALENEIEIRLPHLRQPIKASTIETALPVPIPNRSLFACSIATFLCSILSGVLTGMGLLIKRRRCLETE